MKAVSRSGTAKTGERPSVAAALAMRRSGPTWPKLPPSSEASNIRLKLRPKSPARKLLFGGDLVTRAGCALVVLGLLEGYTVFKVALWVFAAVAIDQRCSGTAKMQ